MLFFHIYLLGFIIALFYVSSEFIEFCKKNKIDYRYMFNNDKILFNIILDSLGSWITIIVYYINRNK